MVPEHRRRQLIDHLREHGVANVAELATDLRVSPSTVRRDLHMLEDQGWLQRTHGGAVLPEVSASFEPPYTEKLGRMASEKRAIARLAAEHVGEGEVVILDSGSTTLALALELKRRRRLTVITTDLKIGEGLCGVPSFEVIVVGGRVRPEFYAMVGPFAEQTLRQVHANVAFLGADAIDLHRGVSNASLDEVPIKQLAIAAADRTVLIADHTKFGRESLAKVADLTRFDLVITDAGLDPILRAAIRDAGIELAVATEEP